MGRQSSTHLTLQKLDTSQELASPKSSQEQMENENKPSIWGEVMEW